MIDEIDYFPRREQHNKKKKMDSGWGDLKQQKFEQDTKSKDQKKRDSKNSPGQSEKPQKNNK